MKDIPFSLEAVLFCSQHRSHVRSSVAQWFSPEVGRGRSVFFFLTHRRFCTTCLFLVVFVQWLSSIKCLINSRKLHPSIPLLSSFSYVATVQKGQFLCTDASLPDVCLNPSDPVDLSVLCIMLSLSMCFHIWLKPSSNCPAVAKKRRFVPLVLASHSCSFMLAPSFVILYLIQLNLLLL